MDSINNQISQERLEPAPSVLYVVGTPIGNLGDLSPRAKYILTNVSIIACEDTRRSALLLKNFGATTNLLSFHKHNTKSRIPTLIKLLKEKNSLALISDAGLPGISDPGQELIAKAKESNFEVICIPGPCAAITALVTSGFRSQRFCFEGFLPTKREERKRTIELIAKEKRTTILYESPHKLITLLEDLAKHCGEDRPLHIGRELTKRYEEAIGPTIESALNHFSKKTPRGEFTLVLGGAQLEKHQYISHSELINKMKTLINNQISPSEATKIVAKETGHTKRLLYSLIHKELSKEEESKKKD